MGSGFDYWFYYCWGGTESLGILFKSLGVYYFLVLWPLWPIIQTPMIDEDDFWSSWWNELWQGKPKYSEKTYPSTTLSATISHMTRSRTPDRSGGKPATNRLSYGAALMIGFIDTSVQLQSIITAHTLNSFWTTSVWRISDCSQSLTDFY
jgi:hypothetical protein